MNRLQHLAECSAPGEDSFPGPLAIEAGTFSHSSEGRHALFSPLHYERNYAYPLIVWLHSAGDDQRQLKRIMPLVSMRNYVAVAPQGLQPQVESTAPAGRFWPQDADSVALAEEQIDQAVWAASERFNINPARIWLAGLGAGATMAFRAALDEPGRYAGVLGVGGGLPSGGAPFARLPEIRRLRVFLAAGRDSTAYPEAHVCRDLRLLYTAGLEVDLRLYPCGDELTTQMLSDMDRWIMGQLAAAAVAAVR